MKKILTLYLICCSVISKADYWTQKTNFGGVARWGAVGFSIGTKGYIGTGRTPGLLNDFWEWDQTTNIWTQKSDLPTSGRFGAIGFAIGSKGYIGTGNNGLGYFNDFWEWDQPTNIWTQKANPVVGNYLAVGFSIGTKGYIGTANLGLGFWEWDPITNIWSQKANVTGRQIGVGFSIGSKGYIGTGTNGSGVMLNDFWEWDQATNIWTQKANFGGAARAEATGFSIGNEGYIGIGTIQIGSGTVSDFWKYNPSTNTWTQMANFGAGLKEMAAGFSIGCKGYIGTGYINDDDANPSNDFWEYTPDTSCTTGIEELASDLGRLKFSITPNPANDFLIIHDSLIKEKIILTLSDVNGKIILQTQPEIKNHKSSISIRNLSKGIYFVEVRNGNQKAVRKFVKE